MAKIAFLLLAHKDPDLVVEQARALTAHGDTVTVHFDKRAGTEGFARIKAGLKSNPNVAYAPRVRCGWGTWSLVKASLGMIRTAKRRFEGITHYYLMSGDCYPTKSRSYIERFLETHHGSDFIEINDFYDGGWIRTGPAIERLIYRHWFNERERKWLFYTSMNLQRRMGWERKPPKDLSMRIGSQWWLLRASTIDKLLKRLKQRPDIVRFFKTTWIPDEIFFQSMVASINMAQEIWSHPPTHLIFSDYGMPVVFYDDHADYLRAQNWLFARKLSPDAHELRRDLLDVFASDRAGEAEGGTESGLYDYLTTRGRRGDRYAPRFWEKAIAPPEDGELLIVAAKIWHIGKAVEDAVSRIANVTRLGYLFDEDQPLPMALGNLESGREKRGRHRRALINIVLDRIDEKRAVLCIDPSRLDVINDLVAARGQVRVLAVERPIPDAHLDDHARRTGLIGVHSGGFERAELRRALRYEFDTEVETLRRAHKGRLFRNDLARPREENVLDIGHFLHCTRPMADAIAREAERFGS
ncbi:MAG: DUF5928 domain-containing protein [Pseudomonadota bacterium]